MGPCLSSKSHAYSGPRFDEIPTDAQDMEASQFPLLSFNTLLTKIKLKRCAGYVVQL